MGIIIYYLSVTLNLWAGLYLISEFVSKKTEIFEPIANGLRKNKIYGYTFVGLVLAIAVLKLFFVMPSYVEKSLAVTGGETMKAFFRKGAIPVIGDLLPFIAGTLAGVTILFDLIFSKKDSVEDVEIDSEDQEDGDGKKKNKIALFLLSWKTVIGFSVMVVAVLHLILSGVLFI
ncbi:MAG: hypothetical protein JXR63_12790 [Spirochaetales bacterium]|nr:hypothetical protein [Spirochaetales bacterium]